MTKLIATKDAKAKLNEIIFNITQKHKMLRAEKAAQEIEIKRLRDKCKPLLRANHLTMNAYTQLEN